MISEVHLKSSKEALSISPSIKFLNARKHVGSMDHKKKSKRTSHFLDLKISDDKLLGILAFTKSSRACLFGRQN